ncbi:MAG: TIGR02391 family protein [Candidatus Moranbacteria bacterium]|jgi:uncharacterized protein (TIGR02391 family)|nr:TIGR02391 family protein [Candidatus Moranbacteria bacterium]
MKYGGYIFNIKIKSPAFEDAFLKYSELADSSTENEESVNKLLGIHPAVEAKCLSLHNSGAHAEAVEKSFKIVKDKLRTLTGYESGSDAFGKGNLYIKGAAAPNVDDDFNKAVKFLMMAIDMFRNEKSHTSDAKIKNPIRSYQYLVMSSLALYLLENSEIKK